METKRTLENFEFFTNASPFETLCGKVASYEAKVFPNKFMHELISCALLSRFFPLGEFVGANKQKANVIGW